MSFRQYALQIIICFLLTIPFVAFGQDYPVRNNGLQAVVLNWNTPTEREDGSPLSPSEIGGFEILYRIVGSGADWSEHLIEDGTVTTTGFNSLAPGEYEFAIASFDTEGIFSIYTAGDQTVRIIAAPNAPTLQVSPDPLASQVKAWYDCVELKTCVAQVQFTIHPEK